MRKEINYHEYLASREWALLKVAVQERSGGICERCKLGPHQQTHHLTYERLGQEHLEDLQGVCRPCHEFLSAKSNNDPLRLVPDGTGEAVERFKTWGDRLPLKAEAFDEYNAIIQSAIVAAAPEVAVQLAQVKLEANRRLYWHLVGANY